MLEGFSEGMERNGFGKDTASQFAENLDIGTGTGRARVPLVP